jgi:hypothetical protein
MKSVKEQFLNPVELKDYYAGKPLDEFIDILKGKFDFSNNEYSHKLIINATIDRHCVSDDSIDYFYCVTERPETDEEYEKRIEQLRLLQIEKEKILEEKRIKDEEDRIKDEESDKQLVKSMLENNFYRMLDDIYEQFTKEEFQEMTKNLKRRYTYTKNKNPSNFKDVKDGVYTPFI